MKNSSRKNMFYIIASIVLSMIVHFCFLALFMQITLSSDLFKSPQKKPSRRFKPLKMQPKLPQPAAGPKKGEKTAVKKVDLPSNVPDTVDVPDATKNKDGKKDGEKYDLPKSNAIPKAPKDPQLPKIVTVDGDALPTDRKKFNRNLIPKLARTDEATEFASKTGDDKGGKGATPKLPVNMRLTLPDTKPTPEQALPTTKDTSLLPEEKTSPMDLMIDVKLYKFPLPEGGGFFRIDLSPNAKAAAMQTFKKDVIFLLDVSGSIGRIRLEEMKQGLFRTLETLDEADRFNIVAFRSGNIPMFVEPMHPSKKNIQHAKGFLFKMRHSGSTNIYSALELYGSKQHRAAARPLILFLISDGKVNYGEITNNSKLINSVSNRNHDGAAIYSFSCGRYKNSFLMDLLSYRNRGESKDIKLADHSNMALSRFIVDVNAIKVADLGYQVSSNLAENTFPKRLPNLHKGKILSVYGVYPAGVNNVGLRITGLDSSGIRRELVYGGRLSDALSAGNDLPQKWAEQYIYHLYSQLTVKYEDAIRDKILGTAKKFKLKLPYLDAHLKPPKQKYMK